MSEQDSTPEAERAGSYRGLAAGRGSPRHSWSPGPRLVSNRAPADSSPYSGGRDRRASRFLYDQNGELLTRHEVDGTVSGASPAVEALLGYAPWQIEGRRWHELVHPDDMAGFAEWWDGLRDGSPATLLYRLQRPNGSVVSVETLARRLILVEQQVIEIHALTRDVTAHVQRADELARQCLDLEERINALGRRNEEFSRFAADAAHDLRAPLQAITGFAQLLARREGARLDETSQHFVAMILGAAGDMSHLLQAALDHTQATAAEAQTVPVDCTDVVARAMMRLHSEIERTGAEIHVESLPVVQAEPVQLGRVFQNLLSNACKSAVPGRSARVTVSAHRVARGWHFSVIDDGTGVSLEDRDRIFQLFHRGASAPTDGGTGIGLAICRTIIERHGGRIWVEDAPGGGSRFAFFLPEPG